MLAATAHKLDYSTVVILDSDIPKQFRWSLKYLEPVLEGEPKRLSLNLDKSIPRVEVKLIFDTESERRKERKTKKTASPIQCSIPPSHWSKTYRQGEAG